MVVLKKYENIGASPLVLSKRLTVKPGEITEFVAVEPSLEAFLIGIGGLAIVEEKKVNVDEPELSVESDSQAVTESELRKVKKTPAEKK